MANSNQVGEMTLGEQMADLLRRKPKNFDVLFSVGPEKVKVEAVKFVLKAASPVFETEFDEHWENGVVREGKGIPLPNVEPIAFQLFINLLILDTWSLVSLSALKLSPSNLLNLLGLCRRYKIAKAIKNLEEAADDFIQSFDQYQETEEFLKLSRESLETIFSFEEIPLEETEIFNSACRYFEAPIIYKWAGNQCSIRGLEPTGENFREVLGSCLYQIRFPTMSTEEFTKVGLIKKNVLEGMEKLAIYEYIGLDTEEKTNYDMTQIQFKTNPRNNCFSFGCSVLSLPQQYKLTTSPSFVCDGSERRKDFQVMEKISLHGVGFLGPIDGDAHFDVTVQIKKCVDNSYLYDSGLLKKNIFARKGKNFYLFLDEPFLIEPSCTFGSSWRNSYDIFFCLKGTSNIPQYKVDDPKDESFQASGVQFCLKSGWNNGSPLAELLFKKM